MIKKIYVSVPGDVYEDGYRVYQVGEKFQGYGITEFSHFNFAGEHQRDRVFMYGQLPNESTTLLRVFNYAHVVCEDYVQTSNQTLIKNT